MTDNLEARLKHWQNEYKKRTDEVNRIKEKYDLPHLAGHFSHITNNILMYLSLLSYDTACLPQTKNEADLAEIESRALDTYLELIDQFPEYRKSETNIESQGSGSDENMMRHYMDLSSTGTAGNIIYILTSDERLRKNHHELDQIVAKYSSTFNK